MQEFYILVYYIYTCITLLNLFRSSRARDYHYLDILQKTVKQEHPSIID